jgi:glutamate dehydrogenase
MRDRLLDALAAVRLALVENDGLNRLVTTAGLDWRQVDVLRAYGDYYRQIGGPESRSRVVEALVNNAAVTRLLLQYFLIRFQDSAEAEDLQDREERLLPPLRQALVEALDAVRDIHEDAVLRALFNLIDATVRCNYFTRGERSGRPLAFKIAAMGVIGLPGPQPLYEIFVHSASMAAIHLRGGKVARGGIRWCDRLAVLRAEVLGLMKTQMIKNAMIVPVGSKGGFYVKRPYGEREEGARLAAQAYRDFIRGLLDLTDNRVDGTVQRPTGLVAYDPADPYLVVAADRGTAHLSDTANAVAAEYGFWLEDAFASGGSHGYDHKQLGITARGAWTCVRRHLYELGRDPREGLTVIGIGDMSGDVFGNGLLLSDRVRLVAAFDHRHIFLDPDPDPKRSFAERRRLFRLERSCWADYDPALISAGGGVFARDAKDIRLSPQACRLLRVCHRSVNGPGLVRLVLAAPADLLWNGGIGTYVKAEGEPHQDACDPANDPVRIDACQLRVKMVGEGGNLGLTQRARIQFSLRGGLVNLDAVDNAGGVACSDREVNLKIFLRQLLDEGELSCLEERDRLLAELADEVREAVLADCDQQALCLSLDQARCDEGLESFLAQSESLVNGGWLDADENHLPDPAQVLARATPSLTRPELAVLMAGSKMQLYHALLADGLPDSPLGRHYLRNYFPEPLRTRFGRHLADHSLAREIAATVMTNTVINQAGSAFAGRLSRQTGADPARVVKLYLLFDRMLEGPRLRRALQTLENRWPFARQRALLLNLERTLEVFCRWALLLHLDISLEDSVLHSFRRDLVGFFHILDGILPPERQQACLTERQQLARDGLENGLARLAAMLDCLGDFLPVVSLALRTGRDLSTVARTLADVRCFLGLDELARQLDTVPARERWDRLARQTLRSKCDALAFDFALAVWREADGDRQAWFAARRCRLRTLREQQARLRSAVAASYHPFVVLVGALEALLGPGRGTPFSPRETPSG